MERPARGLAARTGLHVARVEHLLQPVRLADRGAAGADRGTTPALGEPLAGADDYLRAEIVYAASHEGARHLDDVLTRRTRISIETFDRGTAQRPRGRRADGAGAGLGQGADRARRSSTTRSGSRRSASRSVQPDDLTADAARLGAPDIVPL